MSERSWYESNRRFHFGPVEVGLLIGGRTVHTAETTAIHDPGCIAEVVGFAAKATEAEVKAAVDAAADAWGAWSVMSPQQRAEAVLEGLSAVLQERERLAELLSLENGKLRSEAAKEFDSFEHRCRLAAERAADVASTHTFTLPPARSQVDNLSVGVVSIIIPFNWPIAILSSSLAFALIAGNSVIVKPPPSAPLTVTLTMGLMSSVLPAGVLSVVTGDNDAMRPLISDPAVAHVVFTGSTAAGKNIMRAAAENLAGVTLELGGNDPAILLEDAKLDSDEMTRIVSGIFSTTGQVCMAIKRIYVPYHRYDEVAALMTSALDGYVVGHGLSPESTMGPVHSAVQMARVKALVDEARSSGAEVRELGRLNSSIDESIGHYLRPSLVLNPDEGLAVVTEEQFGPVVPLIPYTEADELVDRLNSEWSGLNASVWSGDFDRAANLARRLRVGTVWINSANAVAKDDRVPFGGFRQSGLGRALGPGAFDAFLEPRSITSPS